MVSQAQAKLSLLQNDKTYKPSSGMTLSVGPTYRLTSKWMLLTGVDLLRESQAYWADRPDPMSGRTAIIASAGAVYRFNTTVAMMAQGRVTAAQWSEMDQITQPFVGVLGVTVTPQKR
jgi:long-subunit fatty acid transport protein